MPHTAPSFSWLENQASGLCHDSVEPFHSLLYVGWRKDTRPWWYEKLCTEIWDLQDICVLEIFQNNVDDLQKKIEEGVYDVKWLKGDVRKIDELEDPIKKGEFDVIFWDHGPEHISFVDLKCITPKLLDYAGKMLIYCCPWGKWPQGSLEGNNDEIHRCSLAPKQLEEMGFTVKYFGTSGRAGQGELIAYKIKQTKQMLIDELKSQVKDLNKYKRKEEHGRDVQGKFTSRVGRFFRSLLWWWKRD